MKKHLIVILQITLLLFACTKKNATTPSNNSKDSVSENEAMQEFSDPNREGNRGDASDSATLAEIEEFNNSDYGSPGINDSWAEMQDYESDFFKSLKNAFQNSDLFVFDSIPFITAGQGIYAKVEWLQKPEDLLGIDEFVLLLNPNSPFSKNELRLNNWYFEDECQLEEFPDGIYTNGMNDKINYLSYPIFEDQQKEFNVFKIKLKEFDSDLIQTYYFTWRTISDEKISAKIHTLKVGKTFKVFAVSNFICGS